MGLLERAIVTQLLELTPKEKRDDLEIRIVRLLGGNPNRRVSNLARRRGRADGGLDGRVDVLMPPSFWPQRSDQGHGFEAEAAINIKVRKSKFTRDQLGAFLNDMNREHLRVGIIISASGLSQDAQSEVKRHNDEGKVAVVHFLLEQVISARLPLPGFRFKGGELASTIKRNLAAFLSETTGDSEVPGN